MAQLGTFAIALALASALWGVVASLVGAYRHRDDFVRSAEGAVFATALATTVAAVSLLRDKGAADIRVLCLLAAPEGVAAMRDAHPEVPIVTAALDKRLNDKGYIVPGLGDAGDRMFGTK